MQARRWLGAVAVLGLLAAGAAWYARSGKHASRSDVGVASLKGKKNLIAVAVVGSGPAGLSAAVYGSRFNLHTVVFEGKKPGGQLTSTSDVENWPGIMRDLGPKIMERVRNQAVQFGALMSSATVEKIDVSSWPYAVSLDDGTTVYALTIVVATGASPVTLKVPGEAEYWGKGVTSCAVCDAPFFRDKKVVVVGGGDAAVEEALQLASYATEITVLVRSDKMRASHAMQQRLKAYNKISVRYHTKVQEILGNGSTVTGVRVVSNDKEETLSVDGVFLAIGHVPNSALVQSIVACDSHNYIIVDAHRQLTSQPGIFAAGDVADHFYRQAGIASGDGIKAAIDAAAFLREHGMDDAALVPFEGRWFDPQEGGSTSELPSVASAEEFSTVITGSVPVVVDFYTPQCPSCKMLMPHVAAVAQQYGDRLKAVKVDGAALPEIMKQYSISSVPALLVFKEGMVVGRASAVTSRRDVQTFVAQFVG